jgi:hypothetical protein
MDDTDFDALCEGAPATEAKQLRKLLADWCNGAEDSFRSSSCSDTGTLARGGQNSLSGRSITQAAPTRIHRTTTASWDAGQRL